MNLVHLCNYCSKGSYALFIIITIFFICDFQYVIFIVLEILFYDAGEKSTLEDLPPEQIIDVRKGSNGYRINRVFYLLNYCS